jgi:methyltransferase
VITDTRMLYTILVAVVAAERVLEVAVSLRHERWLRARGALCAGSGQLAWIVGLHTAWLVACPAEVWLLRRPLLPWLAAAGLVALTCTMAVRYWVIATLRERWTLGVLVLPGVPLVRHGPYRWLRHPNYAAVLLEVPALPLIHTAWLTALVLGTANALVLRARIRVEEQALWAGAAPRARVTGQGPPAQG